jgi:hypothetical protein
MQGIVAASSASTLHLAARLESALLTDALRVIDEQKTAV